MRVVRGTNLISGALLVVTALGFLVFLPGKLGNYAREPEDVWLFGFWIAVLGLVAALCFANARRSNEGRRSDWLTLANLIVVLALTTFLVLGRDDRALILLLALCAVGPVVSLIGTYHHRRVREP